MFQPQKKLVWKTTKSRRGCGAPAREQRAPFSRRCDRISTIASRWRCRGRRLCDLTGCLERLASTSLATSGMRTSLRGSPFVGSLCCNFLNTVLSGSSLCGHAARVGGELWPHRIWRLCQQMSRHARVQCLRPCAGLPAFTRWAGNVARHAGSEQQVEPVSCETRCARTAFVAVTSHWYSWKWYSWTAMTCHPPVSTFGFAWWCCSSELASWQRQRSWR